MREFDEKKDVEQVSPAPDYIPRRGKNPKYQVEDPNIKMRNLPLNQEHLELVRIPKSNIKDCIIKLNRIKLSSHKSKLADIFVVIVVIGFKGVYEYYGRFELWKFWFFLLISIVFLIAYFANYRINRERKIRNDENIEDVLNSLERSFSSNNGEKNEHK